MQKDKAIVKYLEEINYYWTLMEAQRACLDDSNCDVVCDYSCDRNRWWTCNGNVETASKGSCTWAKQGM